MNHENATIEPSVKEPTHSGDWDIPKREFLKSLGLLEDKCVTDCDPIARTVTFSDGRTRQATEIFTRVMGYHRQVSQFNIGKRQEHADRKHFVEPK